MKNERKTHETLKKFFGEEWIETELGKVKLAGYSGAGEKIRARVFIFGPFRVSGIGHVT